MVLLRVDECSDKVLVALHSRLFAFVGRELAEQLDDEPVVAVSLSSMDSH